MHSELSVTFCLLIVFSQIFLVSYSIYENSDDIFL